MPRPLNVDAYITSFPADVQAGLREVSTLIKSAAPGAEDVISYSMLAAKLNGKLLVWYGAHTHHIGLYPRASGITAFEKELSGYVYAKGSIQFPYNQPLPADLIKRIVRFRVDEVMKKGAIIKKKNIY